MLELQQEEAQKSLRQQLQLKEQLEQLEAVAKRFMTAEAISRYGNLKAVHTEKAVQSIVAIAEMVHQGKIQQAITDAQYKDLLLRLTPEKREFTITKK